MMHFWEYFSESFSDFITSDPRIGEEQALDKLRCKP